MNRHLDTLCIDAVYNSILSCWLNFFLLVTYAWPISLLGNLGLRFPSSIVCIQFLHNKRTGFCSIFHSNSGSPEEPLLAFVLWNATRLIFLELLHGCLQSWHYSLQKGRDLVLFCIPFAFSSEAGKLLVFVVQQIVDWLSGSPKELGYLFGTSASIINAGTIDGICIMDAWIF